MAQYDAGPAAAFAGMLYDLNPRTVDSRIAEEALPFGIAVDQGTNSETECALCDGSSTASSILGISLRTHALQASDQSDDLAYSAQEMANVMRKGRCWVVTEEAVAVGDDVYVRITASGAEQAGAFRNDADGGDAIQLTNAKWIKGGNGLAVLELS